MQTTAETRLRQSKTADLQRSILSTDSEIRKCRDKLNALKRAHAPPSSPSTASSSGPQKKQTSSRGPRLPTEICQVLCELRDNLKIKMREVANLKKEKKQIITYVDKTAEDEEKTVKKVAETSVKYIPTTTFMKYDPAVVAKQRLEHARNELESIHRVIETQMQNMNKAFETAARKTELDKELLLLQQDIQKKKEDLYQINEECNSMKRIYDRKKLCLSRAPKPLDPVDVLQMDMNKEVAYDALSKQESAAVAAKESIAYRANLLCQLERQLKVTSDGIQSYLDALSGGQQQEQEQQQQQDDNASQQQGEEGQESNNNNNNTNNNNGGGEPVRATTLASIRQKIVALNTRDQQLDETLKKMDTEVCDLEYRVKVMNRATGSLEKERNRLLKQHDRQIGKLQQSIGEQAVLARDLIDEERSRSVSQQVA